MRSSSAYGRRCRSETGAPLSRASYTDQQYAFRSPAGSGAGQKTGVPSRQCCLF